MQMEQDRLIETLAICQSVVRCENTAKYSDTDERM